MSNQYIAYQNGEYVDIIVPSPHWKGTLEELAAKDVPPGVEYVIVSEIPEDRTFRAAWTLDGNTVTHDMAKAREIQMQRIREKRNAKLALLDIETLKGRDVQVEKQRLRDLPETIDLTVATTPEELKAIIPDDL